MMNHIKNLSPHQQDLLRALAVALPVLLVFGALDWAYLICFATVWLPVLISASFRPKPFFLTGLSLAAAIPFGLAMLAIRFSAAEGIVWTILIYFLLLIGWAAGWLAAVFVQRSGKMPPFWAGWLLPLAGWLLGYIGLNVVLRLTA